MGSVSSLCTYLLAGRFPALSYSCMLDFYQSKAYGGVRPKARSRPQTPFFITRVSDNVSSVNEERRISTPSISFYTRALELDLMTDEITNRGNAEADAVVPCDYEITKLQNYELLNGV